MRTTRFLLAALSLALFTAACSSEPVGVVHSNQRPALGVGFVGTGNAVAGDTVSTSSPERGAGFNGSGN